MKLLRRLLALLAAACLLLAPAYAAGSGDSVYTNTRQLSDNLTYTNTTYLHDSLGREEGFALTASPGGSVRPIVMACDTIYGSMPITSAADYASRLGYHVMGAVNTDFFSMSTGVPMGIVIEDGVLKSGSESRNALGIGSDGLAFVSEDTDMSITLAGRQRVNVHHFNRYRADTGGLYLMSEYFSTVSTRTSSPGWFVKFHVSGGEELRAGRAVKLTVTEKLRSDGAISIGRGNLVLTAADQCGYGFVSDYFEVGETVTLDIRCADKRLEDARWATGCGDVTASGGRLTDASRWNDPGGVNPRTAIGIRDDGGLICYVVDGRRNGYSAGINMTGMAEELLKQGCVTVVNLDGGGSTSICARLPGQDNCVVVNRPSDGTLRGCATYLLLVDDAPQERLYLENDGAVVFAGSHLTLAPRSTDSVSVDDVNASADRGTVDGLSYTAPNAPGEDRIRLRTGALTGSGSVYVTDRVTDLRIGTDSAGLEPGETLRLSADAAWYGRGVTADQEAFEYSVTGDIGSVSGGVFTAGGERGSSGSVTVSLGGKSVSVAVRIKELFSDIGGHWAKKYIETLAENGLINGLGSGLFGPEKSIRRCDFILMLYRAAGQPEVARQAAFSDVSASAYYAKAVDWAFANGITTGAGEGIFAPEKALTRQQAFTFIYRAMSVLGEETPRGEPTLLNGFSDGSDTAEYAREAAAALVAAGIVDGAGGKLIPNGSLTRAQTAKLLYMITVR